MSRVTFKRHSHHQNQLPLQHHAPEPSESAPAPEPEHNPLACIFPKLASADARASATWDALDRIDPNFFQHRPRHELLLPSQLAAAEATDPEPKGDFHAWCAWWHRALQRDLNTMWPSSRL